MIVTDIQYHKDLDWDAYCKLPAHSFSSLKGGVIAVTEGMRIGTLVHKYILKPTEYNYESADVVIPIATELIRFVGHTLLRQMVCECAITANFNHDGFTLPWRGIPDGRLPNVLTIDYKIINGSLQSYIERFGYEDQVRGYMLGGTTDLGLIIAYNKKRKKVELHTVKQNPRWWEQITLTHGEPCLQKQK